MVRPRETGAFVINALEIYWVYRVVLDCKLSYN